MLIQPEFPRQPLAPSPQVLSIADLTRLAAATSENLALHTVVKLMANTGMRFSEAMRLTWADVDLEKSRAIVRNSKGVDERVVLFGPKTNQFLASLREQNPGEAYVLGGTSPHPVERITRKFRIVCKQIGLTTTGLHNIRVSMIVRLASSGASAATLVRLCGLPNSMLRDLPVVSMSPFVEV